MKKFTLISTYPCLVKWKGGEEFLDEICYLEFDDAERLFVFPATGRREECAFVFEAGVANPRARVMNVKDRQFVLLERRDLSTFVKESVTADGETVMLEIGTCSLRIECGDIVKEVEILRPKTYAISTCENFVLVKISSPSQKQLVSFNVKSHEVQSIYGTSIEINDGEILCDSFGHEEKYAIIDGKLVATKPIDSIPRNSAALGMKFLEQVKNGRLKEACAYLDDRLGGSEEKLDAYFGKIEHFFPLENGEYLIVKKSGQYVVKLDLKDDKICNIEIDD